MPTVIDALLVTLGLDPSDYKKGEAEAAKATETTAAKVTAAQKVQATKRKKTETEQAKQAKQLADEEKKRADATVAGLKNIALAGAGMMLGFDSIKGFISMLGTLNSNEAGLGRLGSNLGIGVHELNTWGLAAERVGGKAEDVQGAFANMSKSLTDLNVKGDVSPLILLMQRLGVATLGVTDKTKALLDVGDKLRAYGAAHGRDNAFNLAAGAGIDATTFNVITAENSRQILADAERANNYTEATAKKAAETQAKLKSVQQTITSGAVEIGHMVTPAVADFAQASVSSIQDQASAVSALVHGDFKAAMQLLKHSAGFGGDELADANTSRGIANNNPGNIRAVGNQKRDAKGFRVFDSMYEGIAAMDSQLDRYAGKGINTIRGIVNTYAPASDGNDVDKYIANLTKATGRGADDVLGKADRQALLRGMQAQETGKSTRASAALNAHGLVTGAVTATPGLNRTSSKGTIDRGGNVTNVTVGEVTVNTQATDAAGTAAGLAGAIKRQTYTAQANTGISQ